MSVQDPTLQTRQVRRDRWGGVAGLALAVLIGDLSTKAWAAQHVPPEGTDRLAGLVRLRLVRNAGASFGLGAQRPLLVLLVSLVVTAGCVVWLLRAGSVAERLALGAVLGGALGNLADRVAHGAVTDWLGVAWYPATFNLADVVLRSGLLTAGALQLRARHV